MFLRFVISRILNMEVLARQWGEPLSNEINVTLFVTAESKTAKEFVQFMSAKPLLRMPNRNCKPLSKKLSNWSEQNKIIAPITL